MERFRSLPHAFCAKLFALVLGPVGCLLCIGFPSQLVAQTPISTSDLPGPAPYILHQTASYIICTNLSAEEITPIGFHMDAIFAEYSKRFQNLNLRASRPQTQTGPMPLYVFRNRSQYEQFFKSLDIDSRNSGGLFFVTSKRRGLATFIEGRPPSRVYSILQHEGFHQFAYSFIGPNLPIWVNEGIAEYFGKGILVGNQFYLAGLEEERSIASVSLAIKTRKILPFQKLLTLSGEEWNQILASERKTSSLLYLQAWSIVRFLAQAHNGKYLNAFETYLTLVNQNMNSYEAFCKAFSTKNVGTFEREWHAYALTMRADSLSIVTERMDFLGRAFHFLHSKKMKLPTTTDDLRTQLQNMRYQIVKTDSDNGNQTTLKANDESLYAYTSVATRTSGSFQVLPPEKPYPLPRITAPGMIPQPLLVWYEDEKKQLEPDIVFIAPKK